MWYKGAVRWRSAASARGHWVARARSLREFQTSFAAETSCAAFLFERRWPQGFVCPACGAGRAALLRSRAHTCECLDCGRQTSAAAGTVMHRSKLPLTVWFWAAHLMATHSNGMSAVQLEAQLGITYKTAWLLAQKLRRSTIDDRSPPRAAGGRGGGRPGRNSFPGRQQLFRSREIREDPYRWCCRGDRPRNKPGQAKAETSEIPGYSVWSHPSRRYPGQLRGFDRGFCTGQREDRNDAAHRRAQIVSWAHRLQTRPADGRQDGRPYRAALDSSSLRANETLGARHLSWAAPQAHRHVSQRVCLPIQSALLSARLDIPVTRRVMVRGEPEHGFERVGRDNPRKRVPTVRRQPRRRRTATGRRADGSRPPEKLEPSPVSDLTRQP